jgi:hypothetical protein
MRWGCGVRRVGCRATSFDAKLATKRGRLVPHCRFWCGRDRYAVRQQEELR